MVARVVDACELPRTSARRVHQPNRPVGLDGAVATGAAFASAPNERNATSVRRPGWLSLLPLRVRQSAQHLARPAQQVKVANVLRIQVLLVGSHLPVRADNDEG